MADPGTPPTGYVWLVDADGNYVIDADGNYVAVVGSSPTAVTVPYGLAVGGKVRRLYISQGDIKPFDVDMGVPDGSAISSITTTIYDISDDGRTAIADMVDSGINGKLVRVAVQGATWGKVYKLLIAAELDTGETKAKARLIECRKSCSLVSPIRPSTRDSYIINYEDVIPVGCTLTAASTEKVAYSTTDADQTDVSGTIVATVTAEPNSARKLIVHLTNLTAWSEYVVTIRGATATDTITSMAYKVGKTILLRAKGE